MNALQQFIAARPDGFITDKDLPELIAPHRLCQCVVRCRGCRFTCAAQDVAHLIKLVEQGGEHVRDVSITAEAQADAARWRPEIPVERPLRAWAKTARLSPAPDEGDYGGAFDGFQVTSDADPGL